MPKYEAKTKPTPASVEAFLEAVEPARKGDVQALCAMMAEITGEPPVLWGPGMVGFGKYAYRYDSGHSGEAMITGFSPRKAALSVYVMGDFAERAALLSRLGKHSSGKACLYIKRLADVDQGVLRQLIGASVAFMRAKYPPS